MDGFRRTAQAWPPMGCRRERRWHPGFGALRPSIEPSLGCSARWVGPPAAPSGVAGFVGCPECGHQLAGTDCAAAASCLAAGHSPLEQSLESVSGDAGAEPEPSELTPCPHANPPCDAGAFTT